MPAGPSRLYVLLDVLNRSLIWQNGLMGYSASPQPLQYSPDGWKEISIVNQRDITTWTIDIDFTIPLNFVGDGGQILKTWFSTKGTEEKVFLAILEQRLYFQNGEYYYYYTLIYKSAVDWSTYVHDGPKVSINMLQQDFGVILKNNAGKTYQYALADSHLDAPVLLDGIRLKQTGNFIVVDGVEYITIGQEFYDFILPLSYFNSEGTAPGLSFQTQQLETISGEAPATSLNYFTKSNLQADGNILLHIEAGFTIKPTRNDTGHGNIYIILYSDKGQTFTLAFFTGGLVVGQTYTIPVSLDVTVAKDEQLYLTARIQVNQQTGGQRFGFQFTPDSYFRATYDNRYRATIIKGFDIQEIFALLIKSMSDGAFEAAPSKMLNQPGRKLVITSGDGIRGLDNALVKITWNNFWSFVDMYEDAGMYVIGNQVFLERKEDCLDPESIIDIGEVSGFRDSPVNDLKFSSLKIGYDDQDYGETNGKEEFNTTLEMGSPITSVSTELAFISDIRGDGFGMEYIRTGLDGKDTTDDTGDGTPFVLHIEERISGYGAGLDVQSVHRLDRTLNPYTTGVLFPDSIFNVLLSPKQCLYRKGNYLISCLYQQESKQMTFQTLSKNQDLAVRVPGQRPVVENANEPVGDLGTPYFKPVIFECTGQAPSDLLQIRKSNPKALVRLTLDGRVYICIPQKEGLQPATNAAQSFQLLARPDNDITLLNDYYGD